MMTYMPHSKMFFHSLILVLISFSIEAYATKINDVFHGPSVEEFSGMQKTLLILQNRLESVEEESRQQRLKIMELENIISQEKTLKEKLLDTQLLQTRLQKTVNARKHGKTRTRTSRAETRMDVSFFATLQKDLHHLAQNQSVTFENVITNIGNAYDSVLGRFVAPVAGTYVFSATIVTFQQDSSHYGLTLNGATLTTMFANGSDADNDGDSQTIVLQLQTGDVVSVNHMDSDKSVNGGGQSLFSGFLIPSVVPVTPIIG